MSDNQKKNDRVDSTQDLPAIDSKRLKILVKASFIAIGVDVFLILLKYILALLTGSAVLSADALHSGGDLAVSLTVLISIVVNYSFQSNQWAKKAEGLVALLISFVLIFGSLSVLWAVVVNEPYRFTLTAGIPLVIAILGISIACGVAFIMSRYKRRIGEENNSIAFVAEGFHTWSDFYTSLCVWITLLLGYFGIHVERLMTLVIGILVLRIGVKLFYKALQFFYVPKVSEITTKNPVLHSIQNKFKTIWEKTVHIYVRIKSLIPKFQFLREQWIMCHWRKLIKLNIYIIILLYIGAGFYSVMPYQTGVELLFGKVIEENPPGWHYHAPNPFGKVILVDTEVTARVESGFRTNCDYMGQEPDAYLWEYSHTQGRYIKILDEAIAITGDENLIDGNVICYYRITNPVQYAINCENTHETLRDLLNYETHAVVGHYNIDALLTTGRETVQNELTQIMKQAAKNLPLGVDVLDVYLLETHPPIEVVPDYRAVASAREEKDEIIHQASAYANDLLPRTLGNSKALLLESQAYATEKAHFATGETENFLLKQLNFNAYRSIHKNRLRWEALENVLNGKSIYILPKDAKHRIFTSKTQIEDNE